MADGAHQIALGNFLQETLFGAELREIGDLHVFQFGISVVEIHRTWRECAPAIHAGLTFFRFAKQGLQLFRLLSSAVLVRLRICLVMLLLVLRVANAAVRLQPVFS